MGAGKDGASLEEKDAIAEAGAAVTDDIGINAVSITTTATTAIADTAASAATTATAATADTAVTAATATSITDADTINTPTTAADLLQWHMGSMSAVEMELKESWDVLRFYREYSLGKKPLELDMLVVKKTDGGEIQNEIGRIFRTHNVIEYKSENDGLDIHTLLKAIAYACLYKNEETRTDPRPLDEITITLIRESKPVGLLKRLAGSGYRVTKKYAGIYYVDGILSFPTQIIVGRELDKEKHKWLALTTDKVSEKAMREALLYTDGVEDKRERDLLDSILDLCMRANGSVVEAIKESENMFEILRDLFEPEIERVERETTERVERKTRMSDIRLAVKGLRRIHASDNDILSLLTEDYGLSKEDALAYLA